MRPEEKTIVNLSILILTLSSPDESSVTYEIGFVLMQQWYDPRLRFELPKILQKSSESNSIYLNGLKHADRIWIPDTYFIKHGEFREQTDQFDPLHITLKIFPNGTVLYTTRRNMVLTCEGNLRIFPFDSPKCFFVSHEKDQIRLQWDDKVPIKTSDSLKTINAYMIRNETNRCNKRHSWRREFSCLSVLLVFSRDQSFYFSTVFVPGMVLVTSSFISFWLDVNAVPARVMIGVTTMLNFCTTTNSFRSKLPVVSNLNAMNLWDFVCMFFIYASMIEFIIVNYIYRKGNQQQQQQQKQQQQQSRTTMQQQQQQSRHNSFTKHDFNFRNKSIRSICSRAPAAPPPPPIPVESSSINIMDMPKRKFRRQQTTELDIRLAKSGNFATSQTKTTTTGSTEATSSGLVMTTTGTGTDTGSESESIDHHHHHHHHQQHQRSTAATTGIPNQSYRVRLTNTNLTNTNNIMQPTLSEEQELSEKLSVQQMKNIVMEWIRRPYLFTANEQYSSNEQLARSIDHISKTIFTLTFSLFSFFYFLTYAFIKPSQLDDWIEKEFESSDW
uniref:Glutamate-gated chloride channel-like n=1 Tax=Dermatophagoides pteronyssinus TaxID=6956 RepID=A0A6P6YAA6_DERPT|nr:glutamate-gated chloride channel-like [Dermatophagoides pteronyssinus]